MRAGSQSEPSRSWIALALAFALALVCSIALPGCPSDAFDCSEHGDCTGGRCCINGRCVIPLGAPCGDDEADAETDAGETEGCPADPQFAGACPAVCNGGCAGGVCHIVCDVPAPADCHSVAIRCPEDIPCRIACTGVASCQLSQIFCPQSASCEVRCEGLYACAGSTVQCGGHACSADCADGAEYGPAVDCGDSCSCENLCPASAADGG